MVYSGYLKKKWDHFKLNKRREWYVLSAAIFLTLSAWIVSTRLVEENQQRRFAARADEISDAISIRMNLYEQVLWGGVGLFNASNVASREEWRTYVDTLKLSQHWPGIQGLGYSVFISPANKTAHISEIRAEGFLDYTIKPEGERAAYSAIVFLEPFDWRNQRAFGYDMWSNEVRREAMIKSRDTGRAAISGLITLVQETSEDVQKGFLMYTPVYEKETYLETVEDRQASFLGWVYAPFRMGDLMAGILGAGQNAVEYDIYDGTEVNPDKLLYKSFVDDFSVQGPFILKSMELAGKIWTIRFMSGNDSVETIETRIPTIIAIAGLLVDILIYYLMATMASTNRRAEAIAVEKTLKLNEAKLKAEEASQAKSRFLSSMSHELRSPLNSILGYSQLALTEKTTAPIPQTTVQHIKTISRSGKHLLALIGDILDLSKVEAGQLVVESTIFNLNQLVQEIVSMMTVPASEQKTVLDLKIPQNMPEWFIGDSVKIKQIILNLMANAVKFTEEGVVTLQVDIIRDDSDNTQFKFSVVDTGIGIKPDRQFNLFDAFTQADMSTTRRYGGTGLGLAISKSLVEAMDGKIGFSSEEGSGSTFWFELQLDKTEEVPENNVIDIENIKSLSILLVEDIKVNQIVAKKLLENQGHLVECVSNGVEAIQAVKNQDFDIVLMDIHMPEMDGIDATKAIREMVDEKKKNVPIIALTADINTENLTVYREVGMDGHCAKPLKMESLIRIIVDLVPDVVAESATIVENEETDVQKVLLKPMPMEKKPINYQVDMDQFKICLELAPEFLAAFEAESRLACQKAHEFLANNDIEAVESEVHSLKGMSLNLGLISLANACSEICTLCRSGGVDLGVLRDKLKDLDVMVVAQNELARSLA
ncbi:CHASE domain-containing protein [Kordiimonas pumila]|uniref:histidine kinase n=1 Tax=Kordiimonas pumila TaxID=2161677 RepID=A0ABV7D147_9PROT|nr:CHASE domain-containing protein [Kordiimonas pumila]